MNTVTLTVNGTLVTQAVEPRTHLADFVREALRLTGTHLGCEHGVCGACTMMIDGAPARSCIAYAAALDGAAVTTIEGLEHDPVVERLRAAFSAEHALQCGYCTPGMLVTARDIVLRLPDADAERVRLELAGNLCRCTGYAGIVSAILRVLAEPPSVERPAAVVLPQLAFPTDAAAPAAAALRLPDAAAMVQRARIALPRAAVWQAVRDPALIAGCIPGARLTAIEGERLSGEIAAALGPITARFAGSARVVYQDDFSGLISGEGRDRTSATRLSGEAVFRLLEEHAATVIELSIRYELRGPLAQFGRGPVVRAFATELVAAVAANLEARLGGTSLPAPPARLGLGALLLRALRRWLAARGTPG